MPILIAMITIRVFAFKLDEFATLDNPEFDEFEDEVDEEVKTALMRSELS